MAGALEELTERLGTISDLGKAGALLFWDERTKMPPGGAEARADQVGTLARIGHELVTSDELAELIERAGGELADVDPDSDEARLVRVARRDCGKARRVPTD